MINKIHFTDNYLFKMYVRLISILNENEDISMGIQGLSTGKRFSNSF